jgi:hypothetical protein
VWTLAAPLVLSRLRDLYIDSEQIDTASAAALLASTMPAVATIRARFSQAARIDDAAVLGLFERDDLPALTEITLGGVTLSPDFLPRLARSVGLRRLRTLELERCEVSAPPPALGRLAARFTELESFVLPEDLWSVQLERELPQADFSG